MLFSQDRNQIRLVFFDAWQKKQLGLPLEPLEDMICGIVLQHPEYQALLADQEKTLAKDYLPEQGETNPFLHMGMHIAIQEQLSINRPTGIRDIYQSLAIKLQDTHEVEHGMMDCLAEMLQTAMSNKRAPDEQDYLRCLKRMSGKNTKT